MTPPPTGDGPDEPRDAPDPVGDPVGSVSEEAMKLFGALSDWARDQGSDLGTGLSGLADHAAAAARDVNEHLATGAAECTYCPVCRTVHAVRQASPEVRSHLASAATSLLQAAIGAMATAVPPEARNDGRGRSVERIDLDDADLAGGTPDNLMDDGDWPEED
ncbi:MAG: hypothetical protein ACXVWZ_05380 [Nocardioides sp.]